MSHRLQGHYGENIPVLIGLAPNADMFNTGPNTPPVSLENAEKVLFVVSHHGGTTGTGKILAKACSSVAGSNATAIPFRYMKKVTGASEVYGAPTVGTGADGFTTVAAESAIYLVEVDASDLPEGSKYCYLDTTEVVNDPVVGEITIHLLNCKYGYPFPTSLD